MLQIIHARLANLRYLNLVLLVSITLSVTFTIYSCNEDGLESIGNTVEMSSNLSDYGIFQGDPKELVPTVDYHLYELSTELFTDYAEKQRLIKLPAGYSMAALDNGLPDFPDGTILVKTFYYYNDKRDSSKGKKIVETRLEIKAGSKWNVNTYLWNQEQTDALLVTVGLNKTINWIDQYGKGRVIAYHIPSTRECTTCHHSSGVITPIGPKLRNLNIDVVRNGETINQLAHFSTLGLLSGANDPGSIATLPDWTSEAYSLDERARAYLDVNCAHCHNPNGIAAEERLNFNYETNYGDTRISKRKDAIIDNMQRGRMPRIGTSIVHEEGLALIRSYIHSL
jgi:uncharacterized repeat protein (TIGR03806 family)